MRIDTFSDSDGSWPADRILLLPAAAAVALASAALCPRESHHVQVTQTQECIRIVQ